MSIHPSLSVSKTSKQRSVLKRLERIKKLQNDGLWKEDSTAFRLPKTKILRIKLKKSTKAAGEKDEAAKTSAAGAGAKK
ncbi:MAG: small basic protein [Candidatus Omnitrophica bacterium]|nr:small basic protein [Candidatus Omnitrophota bacterium]